MFSPVPVGHIQSYIVLVMMMIRVVHVQVVFSLFGFSALVCVF